MNRCEILFLALREKTSIGGVQEESQHVMVGFAAYSTPCHMDTGDYFTAFPAAT
jgi:hypothetical protein